MKDEQSVGTNYSKIYLIEIHLSPIALIFRVPFLESVADLGTRCCVRRNSEAASRDEFDSQGESKKDR